MELPSCGVTVHSECYVSYANSKTERCIQCQEPIENIPGAGFSGGFCCVGSETNTQKQGKVHAECIDVYRNKHSKGGNLYEYVHFPLRVIFLVFASASHAAYFPS